MTDQERQVSGLVIGRLLELASSDPDESKPNHLWSIAESEWFAAQPANPLLWSNEDLNTLRDLRRELKKRKQALDGLAQFLQHGNGQMMDLIRSGVIKWTGGGLSITLPDPESEESDLEDFGI